MQEIKRGQIWLVDLPEVGGSIQSKTRPCVVISNNLANRHSPVVHICPITSSKTKSKLPTHSEIGRESGLLEESIALVEQSMLVNKDVFKVCIGHCNENIINGINRCLAIQFDLVNKNGENKIIS
jgi:mRNA interferase MazF